MFAVCRVRCCRIGCHGGRLAADCRQAGTVARSRRCRNHWRTVAARSPRSMVARRSMFATVERSPDRLAANPAHVEPLTGRERSQGAAVAFWRVSGRENTTNRHGGRVLPLCFAGFVFSYRIQARKIGGADGLPDMLRKVAANLCRIGCRRIRRGRSNR